MPPKRFLRVEFPEIAAKWSSLNEIPVDDVSPYSGAMRIWDCPKGHTWKALVYMLTEKSQGCSVCAGHQVAVGFNDLAFKNPEVAAEWDYEANYPLRPEQVTFGTHTPVQWKCLKYGHTWPAQIFSRTNAGNNCPFCGGKKILAGFNDYATLNPQLMAEWDYDKNEVDPTTIGGQSHTVAWWLCSEHGHSFDMSAKLRATKGTRCSYCSNYKVLTGFNDLASQHPQLMVEWDYSKNEVDPTKIISHHSKKVAWVCDKGHEWDTSPSQRVGSLTKCPECASPHNSLIEKSFREELQKRAFIKDIPNGDVKVSYPAAARGMLAIDIFGVLTSTDQLIAIEYDGAYWHGANSPGKDTIEKDAAKTAYLLEQGYVVVRIRQEPLDFLNIANPNLIQVSYKGTHKNTHISTTVNKIEQALSTLFSIQR